LTRRKVTLQRMPETTQTRYGDLLEVATQLFSEHGYERTTVRMIADAMGVQSGSLYSHIKSKEEILRRIVLSAAEDVVTEVRAVIDESQTPEQRLRAICRAHLRLLQDHRARVTIYFDEWQKIQPDARERVVALRDEYEGLLQDVVEEGIRAGDFGPVDVRGAVLLTVSALNWAYKWYDPEGPLSPEQLGDRFVDILLNGLHRRPD
jgi:TetR/AcrR family transcriptional regulator, cholesterol catabolism regulator